MPRAVAINGAEHARAHVEVDNGGGACVQAYPLVPDKLLRGSGVSAHVRVICPDPDGGGGVVVEEHDLVVYMYANYS